MTTLILSGRHIALQQAVDVARQVAQRGHVGGGDQVKLVAAIDGGQAEVMYAVRAVDDHELVVLRQKADGALDIVQRNVGRIVENIGRGQDVQTTVVMDDKALQQRLVQPARCSAPARRSGSWRGPRPDRARRVPSADARRESASSCRTGAPGSSPDGPPAWWPRRRRANPAAPGSVPTACALASCARSGGCASGQAPRDSCSDGYRLGEIFAAAGRMASRIRPGSDCGGDERSG